MHKRTTCATLLLLLVAPTMLLAQQGMAKGQFGSRITASQTTDLPDGRSIVVNHYYQATFADNARHPLNNLAADCVGQLLMSQDGNPLSASGFCFGKDTAGDGLSFSWRMEEAGTSACPALCGTFRLVNGFGKFTGVTGNGSWRVTAPFADGNMGVWESSFSVP